MQVFCQLTKRWDFGKVDSESCIIFCWIDDLSRQTLQQPRSSSCNIFILLHTFCSLHPLEPVSSLCSANYTSGEYYVVDVFFSFSHHSLSTSLKLLNIITILYWKSDKIGTTIRIILHVTIDLAWPLLFWEKWFECYFYIKETIHTHVTLDSGLSQTLNLL